MKAAESRLPVLQPAQADVPLDRDVFLRTLIRHLSGALEDVIGLKEASGFVSVVGQKIGDDINREYRNALGVERLSREQTGQVLVDLKRRIEGDFYVIEENEERIVLGNRRCPFGDRVIGRPSMCMMTSNVFGAITAENLGYAKVELQKTIAGGSSECVVVVHLRPTASSDRVEGREYFQTKL